MTKEIMDVEETAELLSVKPKTIRQWVYARKIPHFHIGRLLRFQLSSILEWAARLEKDTQQASESLPVPAAVAKTTAQQRKHKATRKAG